MTQFTAALRRESQTDFAMPPVTDRETWLRARRALLAEEKAATRARDALNAKRRRLPMVKVDKDYVFAGPLGPVGLLDLFEGRRQLFVHHFMWVDERDGPCLGCSAAADLNFDDRHLAHLRQRDIAFAAIARAPYEKLAALKAIARRLAEGAYLWTGQAIDRSDSRLVLAIAVVGGIA